jgi:hypothetical protein
MGQSIIAYMIKEFEDGAAAMVSDIEALNHEDLEKNWGESSRCAYDVIYEVAVLYRRSAMTLAGKEPGPLPWKFGEEWLVAPDDFHDKEKILQFYRLGTQELLQEARRREIEPAETGDGPSKVFKSLQFAVMHTAYHDAQLNYIQAIKGDMALHW